MRKIFAFTCLLFFAACAPIAPDVLDRPVGASLLVDAPEPAQEQVQEPQASPMMIASATPALFYTPTVDVMATVQAEGISAQKTHDAAIIIIVHAKAEAQNVISTQAAQAVIYSQGTATQAPSATAAAKTAEARADDLRKTEVALISLHATQTVEYPQLLIAAADAEAQAANAPVRAWVQAWGPLLTLLVLAPILLAGAWAILAWVNTWPEEQAYDENVAEAEDEQDYEPVQTQHTQQDGGFVSAMQYEIPLKYARRRQLEIIANKVKLGMRLSHAEFTPMSICFSEGQFTAFQYFLVEKTPYAEWIDTGNRRSGIKLTHAGEQFFAQFETTNPSPTRDGFTPVGDIQPTNR